MIYDRLFNKIVEFFLRCRNAGSLPAGLKSSPPWNGCGAMRNTGMLFVPERGVATASADGFQKLPCLVKEGWQPLRLTGWFVNLHKQISHRSHRKKTQSAQEGLQSWLSIPEGSHVYRRSSIINSRSTPAGSQYNAEANIFAVVEIKMVGSAGLVGERCPKVRH